MNDLSSLINKKILVLSILILSGFFVTSYAAVQGVPSYSIDKYVIASGGTISSGGGFTVQGSIGQPVTGQSVSGGTFILQSGFWHEDTDLIFKNNFEQ